MYLLPCVILRNLTLSQEVILIVDYILRQILIRIPDNKPIVGHIKHHVDTCLLYTSPFQDLVPADNLTPFFIDEFLYPLYKIAL